MDTYIASYADPTFTLTFSGGTVVNYTGSLVTFTEDVRDPDWILVEGDVTVGETILDWTRQTTPAGAVSRTNAIALLSALIIESPTYADVEVTGDLTLSNLTASRLLSTDATSKTASVANLASWVAQTSQQVSVTNDGDGSITLGLSGGWDDLRTNPNALRLPSSNPPTWELYGGAGTIEYLTFDAQNEQTFGDFQLPHDWEAGGTIYPHVHVISPDTADTPQFSMTYRVSNISGTQTAEATVSGSASLTANTHTLINLGSGINLSGYTESCIIPYRLWRSDVATNGDNVHLLSFDLHFKRVSMGSASV